MEESGVGTDEQNPEELMEGTIDFDVTIKIFPFTTEIDKRVMNEEVLIQLTDAIRESLKKHYIVGKISVTAHEPTLSNKQN